MVNDLAPRVAALANRIAAAHSAASLTKKSAENISNNNSNPKEKIQKIFSAALTTKGKDRKLFDEDDAAMEELPIVLDSILGAVVFPFFLSFSFSFSFFSTHNLICRIK